MSHREDRLERLYDVAAALPSEDRAKFVDACCRDDPAVGAELRSLLDSSADADELAVAVARAAAGQARSLIDGDPTAGVGHEDPPVGERVIGDRIPDRPGGGAMGAVYRAHGSSSTAPSP